MASSLEPQIEALKAAAAIGKYKIVKDGADDDHFQICSAGTDKSFGVTQSAADAAEDVVEVAVGGECKVTAGGSIARGDLLTSDSNGDAVATTNANDKIIGQAMQDGVDNDVIRMHIQKSNF